ncbi:MAG TPA: FKBP-type peptidyl-prolyl cis-trans isomerase [Gemmatimonadaceae bacterium]|nr:FKBP-type peptidyl-prolyl cis-trans isomerase [Gemmatimonadaceae bacterium]
MAAFLGIALVATLAGCRLDGGSTLPPPSDPATQTYAPSTGVTIANMTRVSPQLYTQDVVVGTGRSVNVGDSIKVYYTGALTGGFQFDGRVQPSTPFATVLDTLNLIKGWVGGLEGARVGGTRRMVIGPSLAYGYETRTNGNQVIIPSNSVLVFDVQVVDAFPRP